jgi:hypothetical protein
MLSNSLDTLDKALRLLLVALLALCGVLLVAGVFALTLGYDEAWILLGISGILHERASDVAIAPVLTSGGVYALAQLVITAVAKHTLWLHRAFTVLCTLGLSAWVYRLGKELAGDRRGGLFALSGLLLAPGTLVLGALAHATLVAYVLVLLALRTFEVTADRRPLRILGTGVLAGLAAATRLDCATLLPALPVYALFSGRAAKRERLDALCSAALGALVLVASMRIYRAAGVADPSEEASAAVAAGLNGVSINYPYLLNKWVIAQGFMPLPLMLGATLCGGLILREYRATRDPARGLPFWAALLPFAWLSTLAWLIQTPIPHLRYLWPALASFGLMFGLGLAAFERWAREHGKAGGRVLLLLVSLSIVVMSVGSTVRDLVHGESNILSWEWAGQSERTYYTRFRHMMHQRAAVKYLESTSRPEERILALVRDKELGYLAGRDVLELDVLKAKKQWHPSELPRRLVMTPIMGNLLFLSAEGRAWLEHNCQVEASFGQYTFYKVLGEYPADPDVLAGRMGKYAGHPLALDAARY